MDIEAPRKKILVFDQDEFLVRIYASKLERAGYDPHYTTEVDELYGMLGSLEPDLVVFEPMIAGHDGFELIRTIKKTADAPVLVLTMLSQPEDIDKASEAGSDFYMIKTQVSFGDVLDKVSEMV